MLYYFRHVKPISTSRSALPFFDEEKNRILAGFPIHFVAVEQADIVDYSGMSFRMQVLIVLNFVLAFSIDEDVDNPSFRQVHCQIKIAVAAVFHNNQLFSPVRRSLFAAEAVHPNQGVSCRIQGGDILTPIDNSVQVNAKRGRFFFRNSCIMSFHRATHQAICQDEIGRI